MHLFALRMLRMDDVPRLSALWVAAWQEAMPSIDFSARRGWIEAFLSGPEAAARVTLVGPAQAPDGFVTIEPASAYLHQLVVAPKAKGSGLARQLLDAAKAASAGTLVLDVNVANTRAIRFYEREGFARLSEGVNPNSGLPTWRLCWARSRPL